VLSPERVAGAELGDGVLATVDVGVNQGMIDHGKVQVDMTACFTGVRSDCGPA
jgi:hypothetical protein